MLDWMCWKVNEPLKDKRYQRITTDAKEGCFTGKDVKSAVVYLKKSITSSYKQGLPIDEEYLLNCIDYCFDDVINND